MCTEKNVFFFYAHFLPSCARFVYIFYDFPLIKNRIVRIRIKNVCIFRGFLPRKLLVHVFFLVFNYIATAQHVKPRTRIP